MKNNLIKNILSKTFYYSNNLFESFLLKFSEKKMPNGRWLRDENYKGSMSKIANRLSSYNNHDHCGGDLCKYPPMSKT
tara:strand:- start:130 stop:363 length:234 start_codon:yes stop_codon:yes gene_type:complete